MSLWKKLERGAAAVEFALVLPLFLGLLGMSFAVGLGIWARYQMLDYATAAARYCALRVPAKTSDMPGCVSSYISTLTTASSGTVPCSNLKTTSSTAQVSQKNPNLWYLTVKIECEGSWVPLGTLADITLPGTTYQISAKSAMPFMLPQRP